MRPRARRALRLLLLATLVGATARAQPTPTPPAETPYTQDDQFPSVTVAPDDVDGPADADGRRALEVRGAFGRGVTFATQSNSFAVQLRARFQLQATALVPQDAADAARADLQVRRMRLLLTGHALGRRLIFYLQLGFSERDLEDDAPVPLRDAFVTWHAHPAFNLRVGQMKVFFDRQRVTSSSALQLVERAEVTNELNLDRDIGLQVLGKAGVFSYAAGVFGGEGRNRVNPDAGLLYFAHAQLAPLGELDLATETDLGRSARPRLALSVAAAFNHRAHRENSSHGDFYGDGTTDFFHLAGNAFFAWRGATVSAEFLYRQTVTVHGAVDPAVLRDARGAFVQAGYLLTPRWELAARAGHLWPRADAPSAATASTELTAGFNHYVVEHNLKVQVNYSAFLRPGGNEHAVRAQLQAFF